MNEKSKLVERVIGFDSHPDSFTAAVIRGPTPAAAIIEKTFNKVPLGQLQSWAKKHTTAQDLIVLEASGNSFQVVRTLAAEHGYVVCQRESLANFSASLFPFCTAPARCLQVHPVSRA